MNFAESKTESLVFLTETHINHDQIYHIRNNWLDPIFFSIGDSYTEGLLVLLHVVLNGITEVDTDPKGRFVSIKDTSSSERVLSVYAPLGYSTREQLPRGPFFDGLQSYMENKNDGSEKKMILGEFICTMDKLDRDGENKKQRLYRCSSYYALSKIIVDNGLEDIWRGEKPDSPEFTCYDRSFGKDSG